MNNSKLSNDETNQSLKLSLTKLKKKMSSKNLTKKLKRAFRSRWKQGLGKLNQLKEKSKLKKVLRSKDTLPT